MATQEEDFGGKILCAIISPDITLIDTSISTKKDEGTSSKSA